MHASLHKGQNAAPVFRRVAEPARSGKSGRMWAGYWKMKSLH